ARRAWDCCYSSKPRNVRITARCSACRDSGGYVPLRTLERHSPGMSEEAPSRAKNAETHAEPGYGAQIARDGQFAGVVRQTCFLNELPVARRDRTPSQISVPSIK